LILVDTSVWVDHFRRGVSELPPLLDQGLILVHPFVIGELACGGLRNRTRILAELARLPAVKQARHDEVLHFIAERRLAGKGIGWIDAHLLASAVIAECDLWTKDRKLAGAAHAIGLSR